MKVTVEIVSKQKFSDHEETEKNELIGEITYKEKGALLEFTEKYEELKQELHFKISILEDKIIIYRNEQPMILDLKNTTNAMLETPLGSMNMNVTAKNIDIEKQKDEIKNIHLEYEIELENKMKYDNEIKIKLGSLQ